MRQYYVRLKTAALILPLVTPILYFLGICYHRGFLEKFGIEETLFPHSIDKTLYDGFFAVIISSSTPLLYSLGLVLLIFLIAFVFSLLSIERLSHWKDRCVNFFRRKSKVGSVSSSLDKISLFFIYLLRTFIIYFCVLLVGSCAENSGKKQASSLIERVAKTQKVSVMISLSNGTSSINGWPIECNVNYCAYWLGKEAVIIKNESFDRMITTPH